MQEQPEIIPRPLVFNGYARDQVDELRKQSTAQLEAILQENATLKEKLEQLSKEQRFVQEALITAQKAAEEIRSGAQKQADLLLEEARQTAKIEEAQVQQRVEELKWDIERLRQDRKRFLDDYRLLMEKHQRVLAAVSHNEPPGLTGPPLKLAASALG